MKKFTKIGACLIVLLGILLQPFARCFASAAGSFRDIQDHWAKGYIELLSGKGIVNGYNGAFSPDNDLTKAEAATLICSASGITPNESTSTPLTDIEGHWGRKYITVLPVVTASDNKFSPNVKITRGDFTQMVIGAMYLDATKADTSALKGKFQDWASIPEENVPYVALAVEKQIISGYEDGTFRPNNTLTRAEACVILKQAFFPDEKIKPSHYYIDTVADIKNVTHMAVASDKSLYYVDDNTVYRVQNGKNETILTGNTSEAIVIPTDEILQQQEFEFSGGMGVTISLKSTVPENLKNDTTVEFTGFHIAGVACDHVTGKTYALAWSEIQEYCRTYRGYADLYMMMLIDLSKPKELVSKVFSSYDMDSQSSRSNNEHVFEVGMPNNYIVLVNNGEVYYSPKDYYSRDHAHILRWNPKTGKITLVFSTYSSKYANISIDNTMSFINNSAYYLPDDAFSSIRELGNEDKFIEINGAAGKSFEIPAGVWERDFYFWTLNNTLHKVSLLDTNASKVNAEALVKLDDIISKDMLPFSQSYCKHWTADADGNLYFVDTQNKVIRKIYGQ